MAPGKSILLMESNAAPPAMFLLMFNFPLKWWDIFTTNPGQVQDFCQQFEDLPPLKTNLSPQKMMVERFLLSFRHGPFLGGHSFSFGGETGYLYILWCPAMFVCWCFRKVGKEKDAFFVSARTRLSPRDGSVFLTPLRFFHGKPSPNFTRFFCVVVCEA